jgi:hypothetical protein
MIHLLTIAKLKSIRLWRSELPLRIVRSQQFEFA